MNTERLSIRRIIEDDFKSMQRIWKDLEKSKYSKYDLPNNTEDEAVKKRIARWAAFKESEEHIFLAVCLNEVLIGFVSLNKRENAYELGYGFDSNYHGKGYAKESIESIIKRIREKENIKILAGTALENTPSVKLLLSLGFKQIGTEKVSFYKDEEGKDIFFDGGWFELE